VAWRRRGHQSCPQGGRVSKQVRRQTRGPRHAQMKWEVVNQGNVTPPVWRRVACPWGWVYVCSSPQYFSHSATSTSTVEVTWEAGACGR